MTTNRSTKATKKTRAKRRDIDPTTLQGRWQEFVAELAAGDRAIDINSMIQQVLRESYLENNKDLQFFADKVRFFNELKKRIRDELTRARQHRASLVLSIDSITCEHEPIASYTSLCFDTFPTFDDEGKAMVKVTEGAQVSTRQALEAYIASLEQQLASVGDDAQLANIDLQNMLQKQQQTLQMISNVSKMLHDTAMAITRKIGS